MQSTKSEGKNWILGKIRILDLFAILKFLTFLFFQAWRIDPEERPSFRDVRMALELLQSEINSGVLDSPPGRVWIATTLEFYLLSDQKKISDTLPALKKWGGCGRLPFFEPKFIYAFYTLIVGLLEWIHLQIEDQVYWKFAFHKFCLKLNSTFFYFFKKILW